MQPGDTIADRFEIAALAASGGMGVVYRAWDRLGGVQVAVKVLDGGGDAIETERFVRESAVLAELRHPGIVRYVAHGKTPAGQPYLAMEWLEGETLRERLVRRGLTIAESLTVALRVAEALAAAHRAGVVHRDIKPSNLFLVGSGVDRVKVLDFGVARRARQIRDLTLAGAMVGTPAYMAPEQARGDRVVDARADLFSLGCVLYECLTARKAFQGEDAMAVRAKILLEDPPPVVDLCPIAPPAVGALVERMLEKDPAGRPPDAETLAADLVQAVGVGSAPRSLVDATAGGVDSPTEQIRPTGTPRPRTAPGSQPTPTVPQAMAPEEAPTGPIGVSLTGSEQRVVCVVLAGSASRAEPLEATSSADEGARRSLENALRRLVEPLGARLETLGEGAFVATLAGIGEPTEQATGAARSALAMRALLPDAPMVLVTGRGVVASRVPVGEVIDRGVRTLRDAVPGAIRLDEVTAGFLDSRFDVSGDAQGLYLLAERDVAEARRTVLGKPTTCVGRDRELSVLEGIFAECVAEPVARAVLVTAPAGGGKSRLRYEFLQRLERRGEPFELLLGAGDPLSAGSPFGLLAPAVRRAAGILDGEPLEVRRRKLRARLGRRLGGSALERVGEFLGEMAGVPVGGEASEVLRAARRDAVLMGDAMRAAWLDWMAAEVETQPAIVVLEDLQWGDLPTVKFVDAALRTLRDRPLLVLGFARPEVHAQFPGLWTDRGVQEIRLAELTRKASEKLVRQVMGPDVGEVVLERLIERSGGNPFFLEELIRAAAAGRADDLPETLLAMAQARLDELGADCKRVLRAASVFGRRFWRGGVSALLGGEGRAFGVSEWLGELVDREVVARAPTSGLPSEAEFTFLHILLRDAAYATLTDEDRATGHQLAGAWLEAVGETDPMVLAEHFDRGKAPDRAVRWYRRAAEQALEGNDFAGAIERAERGVASGAGGEVLGALRLVQAEAHKWRGETSDAETRAREALGLLPEGGSLWYGALGETAISINRGGPYDALVDLVGALDRRWAAGASGRDHAIAASRVSLILLNASRYDDAERLVVQSEAVAAGLPERDPVVVARLHRARAYLALFSGDVATYLQRTEEAARAYEEVGDARSSCMENSDVGYASLQMGLFEKAEAVLRDAAEVADRLGLHRGWAMAKHNLGLALASSGTFDEALRVEQEALDAFVAEGDRRLQGATRVYCATIYLLAGRAGAAEEEARRAADLLDGTPPLRAHALAVLADSLLEQARPLEAIEAARGAMHVLDEHGRVEEGESLIRLVYAEALDAAGDRIAARTALAKAQARLLERAALIREPTWRASFLERVPENKRTIDLALTWGLA